MKRITHVLLLLPFVAFAQSPAFRWGNIENASTTILEQEIMGENGDFVFVYEAVQNGLFGKKESSIIYYDAKTLGILKRMLLSPLLIEDAAPEIANVYFTNNSFLITHVDYDSKNNKKRFYVQSISATAKEASAPKLIVEANDVKDRKDVRFGLRFSPDSTYFIVFIQRESERNKAQKLEYTLCTRDLSKIVPIEKTLDYSQEECRIEEAYLDKTYTVYAVATFPKTKNERASGINYKLFQHRYTENLFREYEIQLENKSINALQLGFMKNNDAVLAGLYANNAKSSELAGTFFLRISASTGSVIASTFNELDRSFLAKHAGNNRFIARGELMDFKLRNMLLDDSLGCVLLSEQYLSKSVCYSDFRTGIMHCNNYYIYNTMLAISIDFNGLTKWNTIVPKYQESVNDPGIYNSFCASILQGNLWLFYNDDRRNAGVGNARNYYVMNTPKKSNLIATKITALGEISHKGLQQASLTKLISEPVTGFSSLKNNVFMMGSFRKRQSLGRVDF